MRQMRRTELSIALYYAVGWGSVNNVGLYRSQRHPLTSARVGYLLAQYRSVYVHRNVGGINQPSDRKDVIAFEIGSLKNHSGLSVLIFNSQWPQKINWDSCLVTLLSRSACNNLLLFCKDGPRYPRTKTRQLHRL